MPLGGLEENKSRKCRIMPTPTRRGGFSPFFFNSLWSETDDPLVVRRQSCLIDARKYVAYVTLFRCCPRVLDHVKANVKQIIEGKAAPKVLKKQSDAIVTNTITKGTKAKMASAGMAMYQGSAIQGFHSGQTKEISLTIASFFYSCNIPAHNAQCECSCLQGNGAGNQDGTRKLRPPPITPRSMANCWRGSTTLLRPECSTECKTSHSLVGRFVRVVWPGFGGAW
jgi:hypothetical protein